jgi:hypothetical protein
MKRIIKKMYWVSITQLGFDPPKFTRAISSLPKYFKNFYQFKKNCQEKIEFVPCLHDWYEEAGSTHDEYFWQDLLVARMINSQNPIRHVDIGSRIDGFIAHVASFRDIEVFDVRPITSSIPGIIFKQANLMNQLSEFENYCDSLSCLHALEHFGLGRYGDPIDPDGYKLGFTNIVKILKVGGLFYLSVPIGVNRVEFNANRVFDPKIILKLASEHNLNLEELNVIYPGGNVKKIEANGENINELSSIRYAVGIFTLKKKSS